MSQKLTFDVIFLGGGVAGIWLHTIAKQLGYHSLLLSKAPLGAEQTIHSQGIIHGGTKYNLSLAAIQTMPAIRAMPRRWQACLDGVANPHVLGNTNLDLRAVRLLSKYHYLWTQKEWHQKITAMLMTKALHARATAIIDPQYPFSAKYNSLFCLQEFVIDVPQMLSCLLDPLTMRLTKITPQQLVFDANDQLYIKLGKQQLSANSIVLTAGTGNEMLLQPINAHFGNRVRMQRRPLHMLALYDKQLPHVFAHAVEVDTVPRLTITTHFNADQQAIWYLGGKLAEQGVTQDAEKLIERGANELHTLLPALTLKQPRWKTLRIDRSEIAQSKRRRPEGAQLSHLGGNVLCASPTKLTYAPQLGDQFADWLHHQGQTPIKKPPNYHALTLPRQMIATSFYYHLR